MRAGWVVSLFAHVFAVWLTMQAWNTRAALTPLSGVIVPIEIVDVAAESNVRALAEDVPDEEAVPEEQEQTAEATPAPAAAAAPQPRSQRQREDEFDIAAIARMLNADTKTGRRRTEGERADRNQQGAGLGTAEVAAMEDRVRALVQRHLMRCWRMPIDLPEPDRLVVTVEFELDRHGNLRGQPRVTNPRNYTFDPPMRTAAEAALRAVRTCDPYPFPDDPVVGQYFETWDQLEFTFRPPS